MTIRYATLESPVGRLLFVGDGETIFRLRMEDPNRPPDVDGGWTFDPKAFLNARDQISAYFEGNLTDFQLDLDASGTPFQKRVWDALLTIPFAETASYIDIAKKVGVPKGSRAVGAANSRNPIAIVVPCHRVIGASGKLTGYAGGLDRKKKLLDHEAAVSAGAKIYRFRMV